MCALKTWHWILSSSIHTALHTSWISWQGHPGIPAGMCVCQWGYSVAAAICTSSPLTARLDSCSLYGSLNHCEFTQVCSSLILCLCPIMNDNQSYCHLQSIPVAPECKQSVRYCIGQLIPSVGGWGWCGGGVAVPLSVSKRHFIWEIIRGIMQFLMEPNFCVLAGNALGDVCMSMCLSLGCAVWSLFVHS